MKERINNVYHIDGKRCINEIETCTCLEKRAERYFVTCNIFPLGECYCYYDCTQKRIENQYGEYMYLSEKANVAVLDAIREYQKTISELKTDLNIKKCNIDGKFALYFRAERDNVYTYHAEFITKGDKHITALYKNVSMKEMLDQVSVFATVLDKKYEYLLPALKRPDNETIKENLFYMAATESNDVIFQNKLKLYYGIATKKEM